MTYEIPTDLIEAQRAYWEADARVQEVTNALPSAQETLEGAMTDEQREELAQVRAERLRWVDVLYEHEWFTTVDDPHKARTALQKAAKGEA